MNILKFYIPYILILGILAGCSDNYVSRSGKILQGDHELRRFKTVNEQGSKWSASYFLIMGQADGDDYNDTYASFSWKMNTGEFAISRLPINKIRVKIDSTVTTPYVKFNWQKENITDITQLFKYYINYMVIVCKEEHYPINIDLEKL